MLMDRFSDVIKISTVMMAVTKRTVTIMTRIHNATTMNSCARMENASIQIHSVMDSR